MARTRDEYVRVKKCPVCGKARCLVSEDGAICCCWRVTEGAFKIGDNGMGVHKIDGKQRVEGSPLKTRADEPVDHEYWDRYIRGARMAYSVTKHKLGASLGLSEASLERLGVGILDARTLVGQMKTSCRGPFAWSFPMFNEFGRPIGIRLRSTTGFKYAADGSHNGLFIPRDIPATVERLYIVEGPTDTAAALDLGWFAIGRPMNVGVEKMIATAVMARKPGRVTIVVDKDDNAVASAATTRGALELLASLPDVVLKEIEIPPIGFKDLREYLNHRRDPGATA